MIAPPNEPMWLEFKPLWRELRGVGGPLLVAGGYGLLLRQHWLHAQTTVPIAVGLDRWADATPRVTKDLDVVVGLDLISSAQAQAQLSQSIARCGFVATAQNPRWQFRKDVAPGRAMLVEFHSPLPPPGSRHLQTDKIRVKHRPSLGDGGIHGRQNPEAVGCEHHPFQFEIDDLAIVVPHPVPWCVMKLTAMRDHWNRAEDSNRPPKARDLEREQAIKHARDVCRAIAMATREEADRAVDVIDHIRTTPTFTAAVDLASRFFGNAQAWGTRVVAGAWLTDDLEVIRTTLARWFR